MHPVSYTYKPSSHPGHDGNGSGIPSDLFGMALDYFAGDYCRMGTYINSTVSTHNNYNGNVTSMRWSIAGQNTEGTNITAGQEWAYAFTYDRKNQLTSGNFGIYDHHFPADGHSLPDTSQAKGDYYNNFTPSNNYSMQCSYDKNGNITHLSRNAYGGPKQCMMDDMDYTYVGGTNRTERIYDHCTNNEYNDFPSSGIGDMFTYDEIGRLVDNPYDNHYYIYNATGKVVEIKDTDNGNRTIAEYKYDEGGMRVEKKVYSYAETGNTIQSTYYIYDGSGRLMSTYMQEEGQDIAQGEVPIYGNGRIGVYNAGEDRFVYELKDHLGNVRVTFTRDAAGQPELLSHKDYYPYGMPMPGRQLNPANHRYGYQGEFAEKDRETGFNHFELRDYDSRIGRWFAPDPYHQFISPYIGMGNNPIFHIDPSGGYCPESYYSKMSSVREAIKNISRNRNAMHEYWMQNHTSGGQSMNMATGSGMVNATCTTSEGDVIWVEGYVQALEYTVIEGSNYRSQGGQLYYTGGSPSVAVYYREVNSNNETVDMGVMEMSEFLDFAMDFYSQTATPNAQGDDRAGIVEKIFNDYFIDAIPGVEGGLSAEYNDRMPKEMPNKKGEEWNYVYGTYKFRKQLIIVYRSCFDAVDNDGNLLYPTIGDQMKQVFLTIGHETSEFGLQYYGRKCNWCRDNAAMRWEETIDGPFYKGYWPEHYSKRQNQIGLRYYKYINSSFNLPSKLPIFHNP